MHPETKSRSIQPNTMGENRAIGRTTPSQFPCPMTSSPSHRAPSPPPEAAPDGPIVPLHYAAQVAPLPGRQSGADYY